MVPNLQRTINFMSFRSILIAIIITLIVAKSAVVT